MKSFNRIIDELKKTKLYNLSENSIAAADIYIFIKYLNKLNEKIDILFDSCFISDINPVSHNRYCKLFSLPEIISLPTLKEVVSSRMEITNKDFTKEGVRKCLKAIGFEAILTEGSQAGIVKISITKDIGLYNTLEEKEQHIKECMPCHVTPIILWNVK